MTTTSPVHRRKRRLLLLTQNFELCGAQRQIIELALGLDRSRYDVRVGTLVPGGPLADELLKHGIPIVGFPRYWRWDLSPALRLARYLHDERIDIVHAYLFLPNFYSRVAGRMAGCPVIVSSLRGEGIEGWHRYFLDVRTSFLSHALVSNSAAGREDYIRHGGASEKITVIRNGMALGRFGSDVDTAQYCSQWSLSRFDHVIGMVAAMEQRKDQGLLIRAMKVVVRSKPRTGLLLVGDGTMRSGLEGVVESEGLGSNIVFTGSVRRPEHVYPILDIYVQSSRSGEGISNSILEAMGCGLPVVATDVGGNREVVVDGSTGVLVPAGDAERLAQALLELLASLERRVAMGRAGRHRAQTVFSIESMVTATEDLYERLLHADRDGRLQRRARRG